jgi:hypothetical protein
MNAANTLIGGFALGLTILFGSPAYAICISPEGCDFAIVCEVADATNNNASKKVFKAGDEILLKVDIDVPDGVSAAAEEGNLTVLLEAEVAGFEFFVELENVRFLGTDCAGRQDLRQQFGISPKTDFDECQGLSGPFQQIVQLPLETPRAEGALVAQMTIEGHGTFECEKRIKVLPQ